MTDQPLEPRQLVVEFGPGLGIAIGQIKRRDQHAIDRGLEITCLLVVLSTGQARACHDGFGPGQDCDAIPGFLATPHCVVTRLSDGVLRKLLVGCFEFLQTDDVGPCGSQPGQQVRQSPVDVVDVERRDLHIPALFKEVSGSLRQRGEGGTSEFP